MRHMKKRNVRSKLLVGSGLVVVVLVAIGLAALRMHAPSPGGDAADRPVAEVLGEDGSGGGDGIGDWLDSLTDEQLAELDIAFDAAVEEGYQGTKEEWVSREVVAHRDSRGNVVVVLPDGGEFTIPDDKGGGNGSSLGGPAEGDAGETAKQDPSEDEGKSPVAGMPTLTVDSVVVQEGTDEVSVPVRVEGNPGLLGLTLSVSYDESALKLVGAENGDAFDGVLTMTRSKNLTSGCLFTWDGIDLASEDIKDGEILVLRFELRKGAKGLHAVAVRMSGNAFDRDLKETGISIEDGSVVVE